jgi:hypothetical protein
MDIEVSIENISVIKMSRNPRRQTIYIPKQKRGGLDFDDESIMEETYTEQDATKYFLKELEEKEKQALQKATEYEKEKEYEKELQKSVKREKVQFQFIDSPEQSRYSIAPISKRKVYEFEDRSIEKGALGNYLFIKYLEGIKNIKNVCFLNTNLDLSIDAIKLFYDFPKLGIVLPKESLKDWKLAESVFKNTPLYQRYKNTLNLIDENFYDFKRILRFTDRGPGLTKNVVMEDFIQKKKVPIFEKYIYELLSNLLDSQLMKIDLSDDPPRLIFPYEKQLNDCLKSGKRYIIFFLRLAFEESAHANMIVIDTKDKTMERYEPNGLDVGFYDNKVVDKILQDYFGDKFNYLGPDDFCKEGIQDIFESKTYQKYYFDGFCKTWSFIYAYFRIMYGERKDRKTLSKDLKDLVIKMAKRYYEILYGKELPEEYTEDYDFVIEFLYEYIPEIVNKGKDEIDKINRELGTNLILDGRTIHSVAKIDSQSKDSFS